MRFLIEKKKKLKNVEFVKSFGQNYYFSVLKIVDGIIGNSSSGISEVPTLKKFTINIGTRQIGRFFEKSIINCNDNIKDIQKAIKFAYSKRFNKILKNSKVNNNLKTSEKILKTIRSFDYKKHEYKIFNDINFNY